MNTERKLATIRKIDSITPIEGADAIEAANIGGWAIVVKKGEFTAGEMVVYLEIDSWVPHELAPFLSKGKEPRQYMGIKGEKLRTVRLRGQVSQGLILPLSVMFTGNPNIFRRAAQRALKFLINLEFVKSEFDGKDVTDKLDINKWEQQLPIHLAGLAKGNFPTWAPKTDQLRVQNFSKGIAQNQGNLFEVSIKLDGSSMTVYVRGEESGVCSRNLELKESEGNAFWRVARQNQIIEAIKSTGRNLAVQSEMIGVGIQGNQEKLTDIDSYIFDIFDIDTQKYLAPGERTEIVKQMVDAGFTKIKQVPIIGMVKLDKNVQQLLEDADGPSLNPAVKREGLVYKREDGAVSFKAISNAWLLKSKD